MKSKNNEIGDLYEVDLEKIRILNIFTKAGNFRGGKIYSEDKFFMILSGKVELAQRIGQSDEKRFIKQIGYISQEEFLEIKNLLKDIYFYGKIFTFRRLFFSLAKARVRPEGNFVNLL